MQTNIIRSTVSKLLMRKLSSPLAKENLQALLNFSKKFSDEVDLKNIRYFAGEKIVSEGKIDINLPDNYSYAYVPLGLIIQGEVVVRKGGKDTKLLTPGDFIGLFETSHWLSTQHNREIGDWTLTALSDSSIVYFSSSLLNSNEADHFVEHLLELARKDPVPQPITTLPLLDWVAGHTTNERLNDYAIIAHTHFLPNNVPFFRHLAHLVKPDRIFLLEKPYSTVKSAFNNLVESGCEIVKVRMDLGMPYEFAVQKSLEILWQKVIEEQKQSGFRKILIVDDGGDIWHSIPWSRFEDIRICGVEQTQRGINRIQASSLIIPPIVSVATSGVKKILESNFIGISVVDQLDEIAVFTPGLKVGILGGGSIGRTIADQLYKREIPVTYYDPDKKEIAGATRLSSMDVLLDSNDLIIGATGRDALKGTPYERLKGRKILASASSADVEFASLLKMADDTSEPFSSRKIKFSHGLTIEILNGGYPINFNRKKNSTPDEDIVLTRCLMYIGAMQAVNILENEGNPGIYNLDKNSQKKLLERWIDAKNESADKAPISRDDIDSIVNQTFLDSALDSRSIWVD